MNSYYKFDEDDSFFYSGQHDPRITLQGSAHHYHSLFEIYYMTKGSCSYFIDNKSYNIEAGDIILIPGGVIHKSQYADPNYTRLLINCSKYYIPPTVFDNMPSLLYVYNNPDIKDKINDIFNSIERDYTNPDEFSNDSIRSLMHSLFILLARNPNKKSNAYVKNVYTETAIDYMRKNFGSEVTLNSVAKICAVSPEHMSRIFKRETGFGFSEYLTHVRLQHAEYLLRHTELSVTETAHRCGFDDSNYFSVIFKRNFGMTPRQMKKQSNYKHSVGHE